MLSPILQYCFDKFKFKIQVRSSAIKRMMLVFLADTKSSNMLTKDKLRRRWGFEK